MPSMCHPIITLIISGGTKNSEQHEGGAVSHLFWKKNNCCDLLNFPGRVKQLNQFQALSRRCHIWRVSASVIEIFLHCTIEIALLMEEAGKSVTLLDSLHSNQSEEH